MAFLNLNEQQKRHWYKFLGGFAVLLSLIILGAPLRWFFAKSPLPFTTVVPIFFVVAVVHSFWRMGWRRMIVFMPLALVICTLSELISTFSGFPFGEYVYNTEAVGAKILWTIPWTVPLAWYTMIYPSLLIANLLVDGNPKTGAVGWSRLFLIAMVGAGVVTVWDLALDPHMVNYESAWTWRYSDTCWQRTCEETSADRTCVQQCKQDCTRKETRRECRERVGSVGGDVATECTRPARVEAFVNRCAGSCERAATDGELTEGCEDLVWSVVELHGGTPADEAACEAEFIRVKRRENWKLACERECCDRDCEHACATAVPVHSGDDQWWAAQGGKAWTIGDRPMPTLLREKLWIYYQWGWYFCIPFSNFYGWLITSFAVFFVYGVIKKKWLVPWEKRAAANARHKLLLAWSDGVPKGLNLIPGADSSTGTAIRKSMANSRLAGYEEALLSSPVTDVQKLTVLGGVMIYFSVSWCNILFAYPSGLVLIALFGMLLPLAGAIFRLYSWEGQQANHERVFNRTLD